MRMATAYAGPSFVKAEGRATELGFSTNHARKPVSFHARIKPDASYHLRLAMQALGELVWSDYQWMSDEDFDRHMELVLDPVITVHPDRVFFEAFNQEMSAYGVVIADREIFEDDGAVQTGTTNIDFTRGLWEALSEMRTTRESWFHVGPQGFQVETTGEGARYEAKVDLPDPWVRGFLQLQAAMAMPGTRFEARPVDLLNVLHFLDHHQALTSPRSMRWEFAPGEPVRVNLEPWGEVITMVGSRHNYAQPKTTRIWGRRRLHLIKKLLPYADAVEVYLKGRALPSFWAVRLPGVTFVLGLSGWTGNNWTQSAAFDLLSPESTDPLAFRKVELHLRDVLHADVDAVAKATDLEEHEAWVALTEMCRRGLAIYDVRDREFRHRELFDEPIDVATYFPPDPRRERARELLERVENLREETRETRKPGAPDPHTGEAVEVVYEDRLVSGKVDGESTEIVLKSTGQIIFGRCTCAFFDENLMNQGPCEHMLALHMKTSA